MVPLFVEESRSVEARGLLRNDHAMVVWWGSPVECWSALGRRRREGALGPADERDARALLQDLQAAWVEMEPSDALRSEADRMLSKHALRAADALQLAAAGLWARYLPGPGPFACYDARLREAAAAEGFLLCPAAM